MGFLSDYYYLDSRTKPMTGRLTTHGIEVQSKKWENPYRYIVKVDSQVEFIVRRSVLEKLETSFAPVWTADTNINFYGGQPSGYMALLRVYRVVESLDTTLLEKGRQGSAQIMKLYGSDQNETKVTATIIEPVLSDARFEYIKDELISLLKRENALIAVYNNNPEGIKLLTERVDANRALRPKIERVFDPDSTIDRAQTDYAAMYETLLEKAPGLEMLVNFVRGVQPARWGEIDKLTTELFQGDLEAKRRLFDTHLRYAMRTALWFSQRYRVDLEDAIQESCIGLMIAIEKYSSEYDGTFGNYAPLWMRQNMLRELPYLEEICRIPMHFKERFLPIADWVAENEYRLSYDESFRVEAIQMIRDAFGCNEYTAISYLALALTPEGLDEVIDREDESVSDGGGFENTLARIMDEVSFRKTIERMLSSLSEREEEVIKSRFGWDGPEMTLEEVGAQRGVTRERIRQIESKALKRLQHPTRSKILKEYLYFLSE